MIMPETDSRPFFSNGQRRLFAFTLSFLAVVTVLALIAFSIVITGRFLGFFSGLLWPLAAAGVLALILRPSVDYLERRFKGRRALAVSVLYAVFILVVAALMVAALPPLVAQLLDFIAYLPAFWEKASAFVKGNYPDWMALGERLYQYPAVQSVVDSLQSELSKAPGLVVPSLKAMSQGIVSIFAFTTHLVIIPIYLFFFLLLRRDLTKNIPEHLPFLRPSSREDVVFLVREFVAIVVSFFRGQLLIGLVMGLMLASGFSLVGLKFGFIIGLGLGILNIIPYLGTIVGLVTTLPLAFLQPDGGIRLVIWVLVVKIVVQNIEGWFLTPKIMGDRTGLHPVVIIVAVFFWGITFNGIMGMVMAIPLTAFFVSAWRFTKWRFFHAQAAPNGHAESKRLDEETHV